MRILDRRRISRDKSTENRARFLKRNREAIKQQIPDLLKGRKLTDNLKTGGNVKLNPKTLKEPKFYYGQGGVVENVIPGNDRYTEGDEIEKPEQGGGGRGNSASDGENGLDDFSVELTKDEFLDILFDGCELPNLTQTEIVKQTEKFFVNAGYTTSGTPSRLSVIKTYKQSLLRRIPARGVLKELADELEAEIKALQAEEPDSPRLGKMLAELEDLRARKPALFDENDLHYRNQVVVERPKLSATMIMLMDISGSMGEREKTIAWKFFILLLLFLSRSYDAIDIIPITHTTTAQIMTQEEFFSTRINGGTLVSSGLELVAEEVKKLKNTTNIYVAQLSDGDNMEHDNGTCSELLEDDILPYVQYYAYIQVDDESMKNASSTSLLSFGKGLWKSYEGLQHIKHFNIRRVTHESEIVGVFIELFKKKTT